MADRMTKCPQCRRPASIEPSNRFRPFCCERCKMIDLGDWFAEKNVIPAVEADSGEANDLEEPRLQ